VGRKKQEMNGEPPAPNIRPLSHSKAGTKPMCKQEDMEKGMPKLPQREKVEDQLEMKMKTDGDYMR
jgi:hypothetical protein